MAIANAKFYFQQGNKFYEMSKDRASDRDRKISELNSEIINLRDRNFKLKSTVEEQELKVKTLESGISELENEIIDLKLELRKARNRGRLLW